MVPQVALWGLVGAPVGFALAVVESLTKNGAPTAVSSSKMEQSGCFKGVIDSN